MDVKTLCLGALSLGDATGYEIRKQFVDGPFSHFFHASYGSIYPALGRLLAEELVTVKEMSQDGRPDKKVYSLTDKGLHEFREALTEPPVADKIRSEHVARLFFAEHMSEDVLKAVYESYLNELREMASQIREVQEECLPAARRYTTGLGLSFYDGAADYMEKNRDQFLKTMREENYTADKNTKDELKVGTGND
jgi:PadR family transcriptional regulator AphA